MRVPIRRGDRVPRAAFDFKITQEKLEKLQKSLDYLKNKIRLQEASEVKILSTTGDYSENAGYQSAKANLRRTNNRIAKIEHIINKAEIIEINRNSERVEIGSIVELKLEQSTRSYQILGSAETNPSRGLISYSSPLGSLLLGKKVDDSFSLNDRHYTITKIS